ncbi:MAG: hypothetical protein HOW73_49545, partial [Polyangiaceae bacterium]|nr:hypothetical protein [Polyangiaceae bacterium]
MTNLRQRWATAAVLAALCSCGEDTPLSVEITTGHEEGSLSADPAVAEVEIVAQTPDGSVKLRATAAPGEEFDLGDAPDSSQLAFELTGRTADGTVVARGRSVRLTLGSLNTDAVPLFIQRLGGFARPPSELVRAHVHAPAGVVGENFLVATGGDAAYGEDGPVDPALGDFYDFIFLIGRESPSVLPRAARSMLARNTTLILIDDEGASYADLSEGTTSDIDPPEGMTWDEVSGGETIDLLGDDLPGLSYVVGATRPDEPTDAVLVLDDSGSMSVVRLS